MKRFAGFPLVLIVGALGYAYGQQVFRVNVELVQIHAAVTDGTGRYIRNLKNEYFEVSEDGVPQHVETFAADDTPVSAGIIMDVGGTMRSNMPLAREAALAFLNMGNLDNEYFMVEFNNHAQLTEDYTHDISRLRDHTKFLSASNDKAPYDGIFLGLNKLHDSIRPRRVLLVLSTSGHLKDVHSATEVRNLARELDAQIFAVDLPPDLDIHGDPSGRDETSDFIAPLGGRVFVATSGPDYLNICRRIGVSLRNEYTLAYRSTNTAHDGKYRKVQVKLKLPSGAPELFVQARDGYYATDQP